MPSIKTPIGTLSREDATVEATACELKLAIGVDLRFSNQK